MFAATLPATDVLALVQVGSPSGVLLTASETAALLVMGSRGHSTLGELLLGSVASKVTMKADIPVILVPIDR